MKEAAARVLRGVVHSRPLSRLIGRYQSDDLCIFVLHRAEDERAGIRGHSPEFLRAFIQQLRGYRVRCIGLGDLLEVAKGEANLSGLNVMFTMDDGYSDQFQLARDVFVDMGVPLSIFPIVGFIDGHIIPWDSRVACAVRHTKERRLEFSIAGQKAVYDVQDVPSRRAAIHAISEVLKQLSPGTIEETIQSLLDATGVSAPGGDPHLRGDRPMTWDQLRYLESHGVSIGSHTYSHWIVSRADSQTVTRELTLSLDRLKEELSAPCPVLAWPIGRLCDFRNEHIELAKRAGYEYGLAMTDTYMNLGRLRKDPYRVDRMSLPRNMSDALDAALSTGRIKEFLAPVPAR